MSDTQPTEQDAEFTPTVELVYDPRREWNDVSREWNDVSPKVTAGALGAAVATIAVWGVESGFAIDVPVTVETSFALVVAFVLGYLVPDSR